MWQRVYNSSFMLLPRSYSALALLFLSECKTIGPEIANVFPVVSLHQLRQFFSISDTWKNAPKLDFSKPFLYGIQVLVEQSSSIILNSIVAAFVRRFFGALGSEPQIINNCRAGDQYRRKQWWKDFRYLCKLNKKETCYLRFLF